MVKHTEREDLFEKTTPAKLHWNFLVVLKVLFEGQARKAQAVDTLKKIVKPVYELVEVHQLRKELTRLTEENTNFLNLAAYSEG